METKTTIYCDGAASMKCVNGEYIRENGGWAWAAIDDNDNLIESNYGGEKNTTNNRMELMAVIVGLEKLTKPCEVEVVSDSKYVTDAFNQKWIDNWQKNNWRNSTKQPVKNIDLWKRLLEAAKPHQIKFTWVKGHQGHEENERCDYLATSAADGSNLLDDTGLPML